MLLGSCLHRSRSLWVLLPEHERAEVEKECAWYATLAATAAHMLQVPQEGFGSNACQQPRLPSKGALHSVNRLPNMRSSAVMWHAACACMSIAVRAQQLSRHHQEQCGRCRHD